jgi:ribosomal protein S18 acetylase RimI-like enzyme
VSEARVRPALPDDAARIGEINVVAWRATYTGIVPQAILDGMTVEARTGWWRKRIEDPGERRVEVVEIDGTVEGYVLYGPARDHDLPDLAGEVYAIYVHPDAQRRGLGSALLATARATLDEDGYEPLVLWVITKNGAARSFYESLGWQADGSAQPIDFDGTQVEEIRYRLPEASEPDELADPAR